MKAILIKIVMSFLTEKFLKTFIIEALSKLAKRTDNTIDDEMIEAFKKAANA